MKHPQNPGGLLASLRGLNVTAPRMVENLLTPLSADLVVYAPVFGKSMADTPYADHSLLKRATTVRFGNESATVKPLSSGQKKQMWGKELSGNWYDWTGLKQMWGIKQCGDLIAQAEANRGRAYQWVILTRPDVRVSPYM